MKWKQKGCSKKGGLTMDWRKRDIVRACLFIKIGQYKRAEMSPITEIVAFCRGRLYKFVNECSGFFFRMGYVRSAEEMKDAMKEIWSYAEHAVETWQRSIRTLIIENRWPEELYNSNFKFMEEE